MSAAGSRGVCAMSSASGGAGCKPWSAAEGGGLGKLGVGGGKSRPCWRATLSVFLFE